MVHTLDFDGVSADGRVHVEAVADHDDRARPGRDGGDQVRDGDPAPVLRLDAPGRRVVHLLPSHRPPDLGGRVRVVSGASQGHHISHPGFRRTVDHDVCWRDCNMHNTS